MTRKKKCSKTEASPKKSPAKANFPKKQAGCTPKTNDKMKGTDAKKKAGNCSSASTKASSAKKSCNKKSPKGKAAKKPGKLPTNKEKRGKKKSGDSAHAGGYERIGQSSPGKGKVITLDFDSDNDP